MASQRNCSPTAHPSLWAESAVDKGATYEVAKQDFRKIEGDYAHFEAGFKKAHDVHHEKPVEETAKKVRATFDHLRAQMTGKRSLGEERTIPKP